MSKRILSERQQFWLDHIRAAMRSGEQLHRYAQRHGLSLGALYNAKSLLKRSGVLRIDTAERVASAFVPVQIASRGQVPIRCRLQHVSGWQVDLERLPEAQWLRELIGEGDAAA